MVVGIKTIEKVCWYWVNSSDIRDAEQAKMKTTKKKKIDNLKQGLNQLNCPGGTSAR